MQVDPSLLRRWAPQPTFRRLTVVCTVVVALLLAPSAGGVDGDPTPPEITPTIVGTIGAAGWYRSNVTVNWAIRDPESIILGTDCALATTLTADTPGTKITCRAWSDGGETAKSVTIKIDKTPPSTSVTADRQPDANGWYNRAVTVAASGTDATSGIAGCSSTTYAGPDNVNAIVAGSCVDVAGNLTPASLGFKYDATPPTLADLRGRHGNRSIHVSWRASTDTQIIEVARSPGRANEAETVVFRGTDAAVTDGGLTIGRKYRYRVSGFDQAMNRADQSLVLTATGALFDPLPGARVASPPRLVWAPVRRASYYNVQLIRDGRKVLSAWPARPSFQLRRTWLYRGRRYRLRPGVYRWYVWPGFGRISAARYSRDPLGSSSFVVTT